MPVADRFAAAGIGTERLELAPLRVADADELAGVLGDPALHEFIGGRPDTVEELRRRYAALVATAEEVDGERVWRCPGRGPGPRTLRTGG